MLEVEGELVGVEGKLVEVAHFPCEVGIGDFHALFEGEVVAHFASDAVVAHLASEVLVAHVESEVLVRNPQRDMFVRNPQRDMLVENPQRDMLVGTL